MLEVEDGVVAELLLGVVLDVVPDVVPTEVVLVPESEMTAKST